MRFNARAALARRHFKDFIEYTKPDYEFNWHHVALCDKMDAFAKGKIRKLMVFMPPQHGKSQLTTRHFPAYMLGVRPETKIVVCSYSATLAQAFNRDIQRIVDDIPFHEIFPKTILNESNVTTNAQGSYLRNADIFETVGYRGFVKTVGVGGSLTGTPIDVGIVDDPFKDREEAMSVRIRDKVYSWFTDVFRTRLHNSSQELIIMCMSGDTNVRMHDGTDKAIKDIHVGDVVSTYDNGQLSTSKVLGWKNQGLDFVYEIRMRSGIIVKANERHPFLTINNTLTQWKRLKDLKPGDTLMRLNGDLIKVKHAITTDAINQLPVKDIAIPITTKLDGLLDIGLSLLPLNLDGQLGSSGVMGLASMNSMPSLKNREASVPCAESHPQVITPELIGTESYASITATKQVKSEDCFAMIVTSPLDTVKHQKSYSKQQSICDFIDDIIDEIVPIGHEEVFDIQIERTENFIANGLVSHNTRWDQDDLAGRILRQEMDWEVITYQAIKEREAPNDPRKIGEALWPERHSLERILAIKETSPFTFNSLYQQEPKPSMESLVFPEWDIYEEEPDIIPIYGLDFGFSNDPTAIVQVKIHKQDMYLREVLYQKGLTTPDLDAAMKERLPKHVRIAADSADPRTIEDLKRRGWGNIVPSVKGKDSIVNGINWIKGFKIHVHSQSHNLKNELHNYQWLMYEGKPTNTPIDAANHIIDGIRYSKAVHKLGSNSLSMTFHK